MFRFSAKARLQAHSVCDSITYVTIYSYPITIEREGKRYYAYSEDFPGVYGLGGTIEEAKRSILRAMRLYIQHCWKARKTIPRTRTVDAETVTIWRTLIPEP